MLDCLKILSFDALYYTYYSGARNILLFIGLSIIIYFRKTTIPSFIYWLILYFILSLVYYLDSTQEPIRFLGYNIIFILTILSYLFLIKIEENGFNSKYLTMFLV